MGHQVFTVNSHTSYGWPPSESALSRRAILLPCPARFCMRDCFKSVRLIGDNGVNPAFQRSASTWSSCARYDSSAVSLTRMRTWPMQLCSINLLALQQPRFIFQDTVFHCCIDAFKAVAEYRHGFYIRLPLQRTYGYFLPPVRCHKHMQRKR